MKPQPETPPDYYWWRMWRQDGRDYAERRYSKLPSEARKMHSDDLKMGWPGDDKAVSALWNQEDGRILSGGRDTTPTLSTKGWQDRYRDADGRISMTRLVRGLHHDA